MLKKAFGNPNLLKPHSLLVEHLDASLFEMHLDFVCIVQDHCYAAQEINGGQQANTEGHQTAGRKA